MIALHLVIYLDNAASTRPLPQVLDAYRNAAEGHYANASSAHGLGARAARALEEARAEVAALLRAEPAEIVFTSGGTEANALAVLGAAANARGRHLVATALEHPAVLRNAERLVAQGFVLERVPPDRRGVVSAEAVARVVTEETALVMVMLVNNELGTVQPVAEIARALRAAGHRAHLHVDAVQAAGWMPLDVRALGADSLAISGHKLHGPTGTGALWRQPGARLQPLWDGGGQERGLRSGSADVAGAVALGHAVTLCREDPEAPSRVAALRDRLEALILDGVPGARPTVPGAPRAPHIASITLPDLPAEPLLHALEARGVLASAGSACASRHRGPSDVLAAIGVSERDAVLRFSLSRLTTETELPLAAAALRAAVEEVGPVAQTAGRRGVARR